MATRGEKLAKELGVNQQHSKDMENVMSYMEENRIPELFNEILTRMLEEKPNNPKEYIIECLKQVQKTENNDPLCQKVYNFVDQDNQIDTYLTQDDFESIFDSYDILNIQSVPLSYLC